MANNIRNFRNGEGWTQQQLAELLGVGRESVMRWENGEFPRLDIADNMCCIFRCNLYELLPDLKSAANYEQTMKLERISGEEDYMRRLEDYFRG